MPDHLPLATGPYVPGIVDVLLGYKKDSPLIRLYYPTKEKWDTKENRKKWINWLPDENYLEGIGKTLMLYKILVKVALWWSEKIKIPAVYGANPKIDEPLKCVVMSHGLGGSRFLYTNLCCELASRGFLVAALEHRENSAFYSFYYSSQAEAQIDKRTAIEYKHIKFGNKEHYLKRNEQLKARSKECSEALNFLIDLNKGIVPHNIMDDVLVHKEREIDFKLSQLVGKLDVNSFIMMGHSFGAATALYTMSTRPEFKLGILLDPWMFPIKDEILKDVICQKLLFINTQTFHIASNVEVMSKFLEIEGAKMYTIKHTTHEYQTDTVLLLGSWLNWFMSKLDPLLALKINNSIVLNFLNSHLNWPTDIQDCHRILENEKNNIEEGLTKPWA